MDTSNPTSNDDPKEDYSIFIKFDEDQMQEIIDAVTIEVVKQLRDYKSHPDYTDSFIE